MKSGLIQGQIWPKRLAIVKKGGTILDSWTIHGKIKFKDFYDHVKIVTNVQELQDIAQS